MAAKTRRVYSGVAVETTITAAFNAGATTTTIAATTGWPYGSDPFYVVISPGTANEEKVLVTRTGSGDTQLDVVSGGRGADGTSDTSHGSGATIYPVFTATDADEANEMASTLTTKGDVLSLDSAGDFVRLGVGTNGLPLLAASGETSGLEWAQVDTAGIADDAVTSAKIAADAVGSTEIASGAVGSSEIADGAVTSAKIADGTIVNADIDAAAAIAHSKLASLTSARLLVGNSSNVATSTAVTGDVTISNTGVTTIGSGKVTESMIAAAAKDTQYHTEAASSTVTSITNTGTAGGGNTLVTQTITVAYAGIAVVTGTFDFECTVFSSASAAIGEFEHSGSSPNTQTAQAIFIPTASGQRVTVSQTWIVPVSAGSQTFTLSARRDSTNVVIRAAAVHTTMNVVFFRS